jgi:hypothetical protein
VVHGFWGCLAPKAPFGFFQRVACFLFRFAMFFSRHVFRTSNFFSQLARGAIFFAQGCSSSSQAPGSRLPAPLEVSLQSKLHLIPRCSPEFFPETTPEKKPTPRSINQASSPMSNLFIDTLCCAHLAFFGTPSQPGIHLPFWLCSLWVDIPSSISQVQII